MSDQGPEPAAERDPVVRRLFALARALVRVGYFGLEARGLEHVPRDGPVVYAQNHAGWFPLDAFFLSMVVAEAQGFGRRPAFATIDAALAFPGLGTLLRHFGAVPASAFRRPERLSPSIEAVGIFPEGVRGNCKPVWNAYRMRDWNRGFVRVALTRRAPIVPVAILGGEECLPVGWTIRVLEPLVGSILPLPLSVVPLPARWKLVFHPPVCLEAGPEAVTDHAYCTGVARRIQATVQATLDAEAAGRPVARLSGLVAAARVSAAAPGAEGGGEETAGAGEEDPLDRA